MVYVDVTHVITIAINSLRDFRKRLSQHMHNDQRFAVEDFIMSSASEIISIYGSNASFSEPVRVLRNLPSLGNEWVGICFELRIEDFQKTPLLDTFVKAHPVHLERTAAAVDDTPFGHAMNWLSLEASLNSDMSNLRRELHDISAVETEP